MRRHAVTALGNAALTTLVALALLVPTAWFVLYLAFADRWWWLFVANSLAPILYFPVPVAVVAAALLGRRRLAWAGAVPLGIAAYLWLGSYLPARLDGPATVDPGGTLTAVTYNVRAGNDDAHDIAAAILASGAEVVALQELNEALGVELAALLAATHPYVDLAPCPPCGDWGSLGVFSAYPVEPVPVDLAGPSARNPQTTLLHHPRGDVLVVNVHNLSTPRFPQIWPAEVARAVASREAVAAALVELARRSDLPVVAMGDFNTTERSGAYRALTSEFADAWRKAGFGFGSTFHGGAPESGPWRLAVPDWLLRIDYVFHSAEMATMAVKVEPWRAASDHRPVKAVLALPE